MASARVGVDTSFPGRPDPPTYPNPGVGAKWSMWLDLSCAAFPRPGLRWQPRALHEGQREMTTHR
eukprot:1886574-Heterocapsa_arctica.AAC.1